MFQRLAASLGEQYAIVLVGTNEDVDRILPQNIISIHRTANQQELAELYSSADVFVNPTREDNFPTVNIEALACGTPVITFATGGSPEIIDESCGVVVPCDKFDELKNAIETVCNEKVCSSLACKARAQKYDMNDKFKEYVRLYEL